MESKDALQIFNRVISLVSEKGFDFNLKFLKSIKYLMDIKHPLSANKIIGEIIEDAVCKVKVALILAKDFLKMVQPHMISYDKLTADVQFSVFKKRLVIPKVFQKYNKETIERLKVKKFMEHCNLSEEYKQLKKKKRKMKSCYYVA
jgi:hypothetical protein